MDGASTEIGTVELDFTIGGALPPHLMRRLDEIAGDEIPPFNRLIAELCRGREHDIDWWVSRPATRNVHVSQLFRQCVQLALLRALLADGRSIRVRVDAPPFASVLRQAKGVIVDAPLRDTIRWRLRRIRDLAWDIGSSVFHGVAAAMAARLTRHLARAPQAKSLVLIDSHVTRETFATGFFQDRYFPGLVEALSVEERQCTYYLPTFYRVRRYLRTFRALRRDPRNFLVREDHLRSADYQFAVGHWWRLRRHLGVRAQYRGFEVGALVDDDLRAGRFARSAVLALLAYRFLVTAWQRGIAIRQLVNWYEGRDSDRATAAAVNWHRLGISLVAFRPPCSRLFLSVTPEAHETAAGVVPSTVAVVGGRARREIAATNPGLAVVRAPGLRHIMLASLPPPTSAREPAGVLVILPLLAASVTGIRALIAPPDGVLRTDAIWWIKRHPQMPQAEVETLFGPLPPGFEFVDGQFAEWLERATVVAGIASSALMEAVAAGRGALCLASGNEPTEIPIPPWVDGRRWRVAYSHDEVRAAIAVLIGSVAAWPPPNTLGEELLSPGDPAAIRPLLDFPAVDGRSRS